MKKLFINEEREFISIKLKGFYNKKRISLKYMALYIHDKNNLVEKD